VAENHEKSCQLSVFTTRKEIAMIRESCEWYDDNEGFEFDRIEGYFLGAEGPFFRFSPVQKRLGISMLAKKVSEDGSQDFTALAVRIINEYASDVGAECATQAMTEIITPLISKCRR
jgi:hypothetical protein